MPSISVPAAIIGTSLIGAGVSAFGASQAAGAQKDAANTAAQTERDIYASNKSMLQPWNDAGFKAYGTLNDLLGVGGNSATMKSTLEGLPGYQFTRDQGLKSVQSGAAARGLGTSGAALKGAATFATGLADQTYGNQVNRLQASANTGLSAGSALAGVGTQAGQGIAGSQIAGGNASAAGWNGIGSAVNNGVGSVGQYLTLRSVLNNTASTGA